MHELISVQEFIDRISRSVSIGDNKFYALVKEPGFPAVKIGKRYYVVADKVNEWLEQRISEGFHAQE